MTTLCHLCEGTTNVTGYICTEHWRELVHAMTAPLRRKR